jgi:MarR family transcriptional regulator, organic hydroperoxide resistance regulator
LQCEDATALPVSTADVKVACKRHYRCNLVALKPMTNPLRPSHPPNRKKAVTKRKIAGSTELNDSEFREFIAELFAAAASMQALRRAIARSIGLGGAEFAVLLAIWRLERPGPIGIKGLADHLHVSGPHITDEVKRLVRLGYLQKSPDPADLRALSLKLTKKGSKLLASLAPTLDEINRHLFEGITPKDMRAQRTFFRRLIERSAVCIDRL